MDIHSSANIMQQIIFSHTDQESTSMTDQELELMGAGSSISPIARRARRTLEDRQTPRINTHNKYDLSRAGKRKLLELNLLHLEEVVRFFFLNLGCQHRRVARCMSTRVLEGEDDYSVGKPCGRCPVCDGSRSNMHLPIYKSQLIRFFEPSTGRRSFLFVTLIRVSSVFSSSSYWVERIFDRAFSGIRKVDVDAVILSLLAAKLVSLGLSKMGVMVWDLVWTDSNTPRYKDDTV
jgi:hypothetical protein